MNYRAFGSMPFRISELGFGCSRLGATPGRESERECIQTVSNAFDSGINFFDTADIYGQGRSERLLGEVFQNKRARVIFATKVGYRLTALGSVAAKLRPVLEPLVRRVKGLGTGSKGAGNALKEQSFSPDYIRAAIERSLRRLRTDYLDVIQLHNPPPEIIDRGECFLALDDAKAQGKIRCYGVSCRNIEDALLCLRHAGIASIQIPINVLEFDHAASALALARARNVAVIARQPLASGRLGELAGAGAAESSTTRHGVCHGTARAFASEFLRRPNDCTVAQAALRFVLDLPGVSVVIAGMSSRKHLEENLGAVTRPRIEDESSGIQTAPLTTGP